MGLGGISLWQLLIVLLIVVLIFGTKRLGSIGSDLGGALKGFRKAMGDAEKEEDTGQLDKPDAEFSESSADTSESVSEPDSDTTRNS
ncbi:MAG: twin-arginine translocase TatA/TatE family subunit [Gammaproteobacteria bacterium]|jgi:sec-independent protein translocase protein TatA|nr:twin-arginine translocase TatA/TatE family subunit [Gammaproteobacteria bacterium]MDP6616848.1 twin-arginine translocase TatA/TatE family subunit [Gammaproteobacteria bacterium]MDP6694592.1 twin-arginine translocase TatA/TatE family subunit [Gammaproteobacteria bacterium]